MKSTHINGLWEIITYTDQHEHRFQNKGYTQIKNKYIFQVLQFYFPVYVCVLYI